MKRRSRVFAATRMSSGACTVRSGAGSVAGAWMTGPVILTPAGGSLALAGFDLSTVTVPETVNSRPSSAGGTASFVSFGRDTYACRLAAHVFQGTVSVAVLPETVNGWALAPFVFA